MTTLTWHDLQFALRRCPKTLLQVAKNAAWKGKIFIGGGFLRSIVAGDEINDIDIFVSSNAEADLLAVTLVACLEPSLTREEIQKRIHRTANALTLLSFKPTLQIIHRWVFNQPQDVAKSFDFTCCCAVFWWDGDTWQSFCDDRFYCDVAAKRLVYRAPVRNEDAGGSLLRVLKYYQKGYRIPLDSLAGVVARMMQGYNFTSNEKFNGHVNEKQCTFVVTGLLREVDPQVDPSHIAHLPSELAGSRVEQLEN